MAVACALFVTLPAVAMVGRLPSGNGDSGAIKPAEKSTPLSGSIAGQISIVFPSSGEYSCVETACPVPAEVCVASNCVSVGFFPGPIRTYWTRDDGE